MTDFVHADMSVEGGHHTHSVVRTDHEILWPGGGVDVPTMQRPLRLGTMVPWSGWAVKEITAAIPIALEEINGDPSLSPGFNIEWVPGPSPDCAVGPALVAMTTLASQSVDAIIGPGCSIAWSRTHTYTHTPSNTHTYCAHTLSPLVSLSG